MAEEGELVQLRVYDLSNGLARQLSTQLLGKAIEAIWHTGVVVYGKEWWFGGGIQSAPSATPAYGQPIQVVELGRTQVPLELFEEFLEDISPRYTAETYSLMHHNCNNFSDEVAQFLTGQGVPVHITGLPQEVLNTPMGHMLLPMIQQLETQLRLGATPMAPRPASGPAPPHRRPAAAAAVAPATPATPAVRTLDFASIVESTTPSPAGATAKAPVSPVEAPRNAVARGGPSDTKQAGAGEGATGGGAAAGTASGVEDKSGKGVGGKDAGGADGKARGSGGGGGAGGVEAAKVKLHEEIRAEFARLMAAGGMAASEAAAQAMRQVVARHAAGASVA